MYRESKAAWWHWWGLPVLGIVVGVFGIGAINDHWSEPNRGMLTALTVVLGVGVIVSVVRILV